MILSAHFFKSSGVDFHLSNWPLDNYMENRIKGQRYGGVFMINFERSQSYQCLLMAVIQVDGHVSIINTCHIYQRPPRQV